MSQQTKAPAKAEPTPRARPPKIRPARPTATRRRPIYVALGVALIAVGALSAAYLTATVGQTRSVLAVTTHLSRGDVIQSQDVAVAEIPAGPTSLRSVDATSLDDVVGKRAAVEMMPGSLLTKASYASSLVPANGSSIVGIALDPSKMPSGSVRGGDPVRLVTIASQPGKDIKARSFSAVAVAVSRSALGDRTVVNVEVQSTDAPALAGLAASGSLALVLDSAGH